MESKIVYNYSKDFSDPSHAFMTTWMTEVGSMYDTIHTQTANLERKPTAKEMMDKIKPIIAKFNFKLYTQTIRGFNIYEDDEDDDELDIQESVDYFSYAYLLNTRDNIGVCLYAGNGGTQFIQAHVVGSSWKNKFLDIYDPLLYEITSLMDEMRAPSKKKNRVNFICEGGGRLYLNEFKLRHTKTIDIENHYNDDFKDVSDYIIDNLSENKTNKGIILLHGTHGTGKTTYLRHLISSLERNIIYVSPDMSARVSDPSFLSFLMNHRNSVLIIEDAENVLKTREAGENQAVSNLLNITDGILGDGLNFQVICTFNTNLEFIDPALRRPGRLIAEYEFGPLTENKTLKLVQSLYGENVEPTMPKMTIAEIFNMKEKQYKKKEEKRTFGFI